MGVDVGNYFKVERCKYMSVCWHVWGLGSEGCLSGHNKIGVFVCVGVERGNCYCKQRSEWFSLKYAWPREWSVTECRSYLKGTWFLDRWEEQRNIFFISIYEINDRKLEVFLLFHFLCISKLNCVCMYKCKIQHWRPIRKKNQYELHLDRQSLLNRH